MYLWYEISYKYDKMYVLNTLIRESYIMEDCVHLLTKTS